MKTKPYPKRSWLMTWLHLPVELRRIRKGTQAEALEGIRYIENKRSSRMRTRPMQLILKALQERAATSD